MDGVFDNLFTFLPDDEGDDDDKEYFEEDKDGDKSLALAKYEIQKDFITKIKKDPLKFEDKIDSKKFLCNACNKSYESQFLLEDHTLSEHDGIDKFSCNMCDYKSYYKKIAKLHLSKHTNEKAKIIRIGCKECEADVEHDCINTKLFRCEKCEFIAKKRIGLKVHTEAVHEKQVRYKCNLCVKRTYFRKNMKSHQQKIHIDRVCTIIEINCKYCEDGSSHYNCENIRSTDNKKLLKNHNDNTLKKKFCCNKCSYSSDNALNVKRHEKSKIHEVQNLRFSCNKCSYASNTRQHVEHHQKSKEHQNAVDLKVNLRDCMKCQHNFDHDHPKIKRTKSATDGGTMKKFSCNKCNYSSNILNVVRIHQNSKKHENDTNLKILHINCEKCHLNMDHEHKFKRRGRRSKNNESKKKFSCSKCGYSSNMISEIKRHQNAKMHQEDTDLRVLSQDCEKCKQNIDHQHEIRSSNGSGTMFKCTRSGCDFATNYKRVLNMHYESIHLKIVRYKCNICPYDSYQYHPVTYHQNSHHKDNLTCKVIKIGCDLCEGDYPNHNHKKSLETEAKSDTKKRFSCSKCTYSSDRKQPVRIHQKSKMHENDINLAIFDLECELCQEDKPDPGHTHINSTENPDVIDTQKKRFSCSKCPYSSDFRQQVGIHQRSKKHENDIALVILDLECDQCQQNVDHKHQDREKIQNYNNDARKRFYCSNCNYSANIKQTVKRHQESRIHGKDSNLKILDKDCAECRNNIEHEHLPKSYEQKAFKCPFSGCFFATDYKQMLTGHQEGIHQKIFKYKCNICSYQSYQTGPIKVHQKSHHANVLSQKVMKIGCKLCERNVPNHNHAKKRPIKRDREQRSGNSKYNCGLCDFKTDSKTNLNCHHKVQHLNLMRYKCNGCDFKQYYIRGMVRHLSEHDFPADVLYLSCKKCDTYEQHTEHEYEESKVRKSKTENCDIIECKECDHDPFPNFKARVKHYRLKHKNKNIYNCNQCQYGSNYRPNLQTHINSQHLMKKLQCPKCLYNTTWKTSFLMHMREKHKQYQRVSKHFPTGEIVLCEECGTSINGTKNHNCNGIKRTGRRPGNQITRAFQGQIGRYKCNKCDFSTDKPSNVRAHYELMHVQQIHDNIPENSSQVKPTLNKGLNFHCRKCDYQTSVANDLKMHLANHPNTI